MPGALPADDLSGAAASSTEPLHLLKMAVGIMLVSFGTFWAGEGIGVRWPGTDLALPVLVGVYAAVTWATVANLGRRRGAGVEAA